MSDIEYGFRGTEREYNTEMFETVLIARDRQELDAMKAVACELGACNYFCEIPQDNDAALAAVMNEARDRAQELREKAPTEPCDEAGMVGRARADALAAFDAQGGVVRIEIKRQEGGPSPTAFGFMVRVQERMLRDQVAVEL